MAVTLGSTRLWQVQEDQSTTDSPVDVHSVYGTTSSETLLVGITSEESLTYAGYVSGMRIAQDAAYSNDPVTALAEWVVELESYCNGAQGTGYTLTDDERGDTKNVAIEAIGWQREQGQELSVNYEVSFLWGQGLAETGSRTVDSVSPGSSWTLGGTSLGAVQSYRQQKNQKMGYYPLAITQPGEDEILAETGAVRRVMIRGEVTDLESPNTFDDTMQSNVGTDTTLTFSSAFPGRSKEFMIERYDSFREAGWTRRGEYSLEMVEGTIA